MGNSKTKVKSNYNASLTFFQKVKKYRVLLLMCLPAVLFFLAFSYAPMPGIWVAFVKYNYRDGIFGSKFIGLDNFEFLATSGKLLSLTKNTILYNLAFILLGNFLAVFVAIMGIDGEMMEAAKVDGANGFQRIRYIILPSLKPTIVILLLFALGGIVKGNFGLFYNIVGSNSILYTTTDIIETYVYRATMTDFNFSTASAVGLYQSVIGFVIVMVVNWVVKRIEPDYALF